MFGRHDGANTRTGFALFNIQRIKSFRLLEDAATKFVSQMSCGSGYAKLALFTGAPPPLDSAILIDIYFGNESFFRFLRGFLCCRILFFHLPRLWPI